MTTITSNIDDLLMNQTPLSTTTPETPEPETSHDYETANQYDTESESSQPDLVDAKPEKQAREEPKQQQEHEQVAEDTYGNQETKENEAIRERLARQARKHEAEIAALHAQYNAQQQQQVQQATKDFEYDENAEGDWQQQLEHFVKKTVQNMGNEERQRQERQREMQAQAEFEARFNQDAERFADFEQTMGDIGATLSPPMVHATRAMSNPAAFLYAAAKRNPAELERIAKMADPYAQIAAMGALEVSLRKSGSQTKAPRPINRSHEDGNIPKARESREPSIEEKMHAFEAQKRKRMAIGKR